MADKPSRALVLYGDGLASFIDSSHTHFHSLASKASCGFLSLPNASASESEDERIVREFAILLDAYEAYLNSDSNTTKDGCQKSTILSISERFMGMKAAIITNNSTLKSFGAKFGLSVLQLDELIRSNHSNTEPHYEMLKLLGFQEGKALDTSQFDLIIVHVGAGEKIDDETGDMEYINSLVGSVLCETQPGSEISSRLHLSVVMSYGSVSEDGESNLSVLTKKDERNSELPLLFPRQSYTMEGENLRKDVRHHCPMLFAQWQYAVTRKDMTETFSFEEFKKHGGNLVIPADRFLHEIAFKLWKAPKYGA